MRLRAQRPRPSPAPAAPPRRASRARSTRRASVLTKKPISPSISARLRLATGVPITTSSWPDRRRQHRRPARQQRHEQRGAVPPAERLEPARSAPRPARPGHGRRHSPAAPDADGRRAAPAAPARRPALASSTPPASCSTSPASQLPLPHRVVGVLDRQRRQRIGLAAAEGVVERAQLARQHPHRPAVGDDVVHGHQQHVLVVAPARSGGRGSAARAPGRTARPLPRRPAGAAPPRRPRARAGRARPGRRDSAPPARSAAPARPRPRAKRRAQRLVARDDAVQRAPQRRRGRAARAAAGRWRCGTRALGALHLRQEPQPLLRERQRQRRRPRPPRGIAGSSPRAACATPRANVGQHRAREQLARARPPRPAPARRRETSCTASSEWPPSVEEVVVAPDPLARPAARPRSPPAPALDLAQRRLVVARRVGVALRRRQRLAVELAVRRQRQTLQPHVRRRHHVLRAAARPGARAASSASQRLRAQVVRHQPLVARRVLARQHHRLAHRRDARPAAPRSRPARCGSRGSSPGSRCGPGTRACRPPASAPGRRCGTAAPPARARTDRRRSARPSAPGGSGSRAPPPRRRCTARPPRPPAPARPPRRARRRACWRSAGRWARLRRSPPIAPEVATTVVSVGP